MKLIFFVLAISELAYANPLHLALNWKPEPQFGGFYAAQNNDEFKKQNLSVEIQEGGAGTPTVQMIAAGRVEYAIVSADELLIARSHGADLVALFAVYQTNPQSIMAHAERGFQTLADLMKSDGTLAWQEGLPYASYLKKKYPLAHVRFVPYLGGIGNYLASATFSQQCFFTSEPLLAQKKNIKTKTFLISEEGFNPYTTVLVTTTKHLKENSGEVKNMVSAVRDGWIAYLKDPAATNQIMARLNPAMSIETFSESAKAQNILIQPSADFKVGSMTQSRWTTLAQQLFDLKLIAKTEPAANVMKGDL